MLKKAGAMMMAIAIMLSMVTFSYAEGEPNVPGQLEIEQQEGMVPLYNYVRSHAESLSISGSKATCTASLMGYSGITTKIVFTIILQKKSLFWWSDVDSYTVNYQTHSGSPSKSFTVDSGTYRTKVVYTVYSGSNSETITGYSSEKSV